MGNSAVKTTASLSNGCMLGNIPRSTALMFGCLNVLPRRVDTTKRSIVGMGLHRSTRLLRRIIIVNCNSTGTGSLATPVSIIGRGRLVGIPASSPVTTLRKGMPNIGVVGSKAPNRNPGIAVHNVNSFNSASPLCMISKVFCSGVGFLGGSSVRSVAVLGSTSTSTVCNMHTTGNIMVVAAGGKDHGRSTGVACGNCMNVRGTAGLLRVYGSRRCTAVVLRTGPRTCQSVFRGSMTRFKNGVRGLRFGTSAG